MMETAVFNAAAPTVVVVTTHLSCAEAVKQNSIACSASSSLSLDEEYENSRSMMSLAHGAAVVREGEFLYWFQRM